MHPSFDFYALGKVDDAYRKNYTTRNKEGKFTNNIFFNYNNAYKDGAGNILERNAFLMNSSKFDKKKEDYCSLKTLNQVKKEDNNYLNPTPSFQRKYQSDINPDLSNTFELNKARLKFFNKDAKDLTFVTNGIMLSNKDFNEEKKKILTRSTSMPLLPAKTKEIEKKILPIYKNIRGEVTRHPKGFWDYTPQFREFNQESKDAPDNFQTMNKEKKEKFNKALEKEETITLLSKNKNWITVTPKHRNRNKPLESIKVKNDETSKVIPSWMRSKFTQKMSQDFMKSVSYKSVRDGKSTAIFVDKDNLENKNKSIFSFGDFRHNVMTKSQSELFEKGISMKPKRFFDWDDGRKFDPKKSKDYI